MTRFNAWNVFKNGFTDQKDWDSLNGSVNQLSLGNLFK